MRSDLALAALASAAVPGMKPVAVAALALPFDEQPDHQRAVVEDATGRRWLVRSPLTPVAGARLLRNDDLVRQLSRHLPFKVPAPVGRAGVGQDGYAVVYPHVEGLPLDFSRLPAGPGLASAVGRAVAAVHNIPRGVFEQQDVPVFDAAGSRQRLISLVDRAAETGRVPTGLLARWEEAFDAAPMWQFATTPVHGALRGAATLVVFADEDAGSGRVVALTDWEEAMVADPAVDLADLCAQSSPAAWESVLDSYVLARAQRPDPYLHARARLLSETNRLLGLAQAVADGDEQRTRHIVESLRRMDRLTEDEDSLVPVTARDVGGATSRVATAPAATAPATTTPAATAPAATAPAAGDHREVPEPSASAAHDQDPFDAQEDLGDDPARRDAMTSTDRTGDPTDTDGDEAAGGTPMAVDDDVTAEVPVVRDLEGTAAPVLESADDRPPHDQAALDEEPGGAGEPPSQDGPDEDLGSTERPGATEGAEGADGSGSSQGVDDLADLDDDERLHELYGMPSQPPEED